MTLDALQGGPAMTDPGERLRSNLAADQSSGPSYGMADFDSPIAMEALRATGLWALKLVPPLRKRAFGLGMGVH